MKTLIVILVALVVITEAALVDETLSQEWQSYKKEFRKVYKNAIEEEFRKIAFMANILLINLHNAKYEEGLVTFKLAINKYADMPHDEFVRTMNGFKPRLSKDNKKPVGAKFVAPSLDGLPNEVDWRKQGAVTDIKDQGGCGSCWAFSATGSLEGQYFKKYRQLVSLSEQNLVDCSRGYGTLGCDGGFINDAFRYIIKNKGIEGENTYKYEATENDCHYDAKNVAATATDFVNIPVGDEEQLQAAVANIGPVSVAINSSLDNFQLYGSGIYSDSGCSPAPLDHAVLVVGYGIENGKKYWLVKNSWGKSWGENGYMKIARNKKNLCGIASQASYPVV